MAGQSCQARLEALEERMVDSSPLCFTFPARPPPPSAPTAVRCTYRLARDEFERAERGTTISDQVRMAVVLVAGLPRGLRATSCERGPDTQILNGHTSITRDAPRMPCASNAVGTFCKDIGFIHDYDHEPAVVRTMIRIRTLGPVGASVPRVNSVTCTATGRTRLQRRAGQ